MVPLCWLPVCPDLLPATSCHKHPARWGRSLKVTHKTNHTHPSRLHWKQHLAHVYNSGERSGQVTQASVGKKISLCLFDFCRCFVAFENSVWQIRFFFLIFEEIFFFWKFFLKFFFFFFFWKFFLKFFLNIFFFEKKFLQKKNFFFEKFYLKIFFQDFFFFWRSWCVHFEVSNLVLFWMSFQILWFHLFHNAHTISALSFKISFHFEFQVSSKEI